MQRVQFCHQVLIVLSIIFFAAQGDAKSVKLAWDASPSAVSGYKIYYKANSATLPFDGTGAAEGASPIDVGNRVNFTLTGLADDADHYISVSAYDAAGNESEFANLVHSPITPVIIPPPVEPSPIPEPEPENPFDPAPAPGWDMDALIGAGFLDSGFGEGGVFTQIHRQDIPGGPRIAVQPDGKFILFGETYLSRYNPDGSLDQSFGTSGVVDNLNTAGELLYWSARDLLLLQDGKILVVAGSYNEETIVLRYLSDGRLDHSFANNGILDNLPSGLRCFKARQQPDGRILLTGNLYPGFAIVCLTHAGALDDSFGANGIAIIDISSENDSGEDLAPQADGKIVVVGRSQVVTDTAWPNSVSGNMALTRLLPNGRVDSSFGAQRNGIIELDLPYLEASALRVTIQSADQILLAGYGANGSIAGGDYQRSALLVRFDSSGLLDETFAGNGIVTVDLGADAMTTPSDILMQMDGKILLAGWATLGGESTAASDFILARYNPDGSRDASFAETGVQSTDVYGADYLTAAAIQPDGKILVAGLTDSGPVVGRYQAGFVGQLLIENGKNATTTANVSLELSCINDGACSEMRFSNDGLSWSDWEVYSKQRAWRLSEGAGIKTVHAQYRSPKGAGIESAIYSDAIDLVINVDGYSDCKSCHSWGLHAQNSHHLASSFNCFSCHNLETNQFGALGLASPTVDQCVSCHIGLDPQKASIFELHGTE